MCRISFPSIHTLYLLVLLRALPPSPVVAPNLLEEEDVVFLDSYRVCIYDIVAFLSSNALIPPAHTHMQEKQRDRQKQREQEDQIELEKFGKRISLFQLYAPGHRGDRFHSPISPPRYCFHLVKSLFNPKANDVESNASTASTLFQPRYCLPSSPLHLMLHFVWSKMLLLVCLIFPCFLIGKRERLWLNLIGRGVKHQMKNYFPFHPPPAWGQRNLRLSTRLTL